MSYIQKLELTNPIVYRIIRHSYYKNKIGHAYIFSGSHNVDLDLSCKALISVLISDHDLFQGGSSRLFNSYPDLYIIDGLKKMITKDLIIDVKEKLQLSALDKKGVKILYLKKIENCNNYALNALLKLIENPPHKTYIIMSTNQIHSVLTTIRSRALEIKVRKTALHLIVQKLIEDGLSQTHANVLASFTNSYQEAIKILKEDNFVTTYQKVIDVLNLAINDFYSVVSLFNDYLNKENIPIIVSILLTFIRDVVINIDDKSIINQDHIQLINNYRHANFDYQKGFEAINKLLLMLRNNVNFLLLKQTFLLEWEKAYG